MTTAKMYALMEKLFLMLLTGSCTFMLYYLGSINASLDSIRGKVGVACEQISAIDSGMKELKADMTRQKDLIDFLHPRKG